MVYQIFKTPERKEPGDCRLEYLKLSSVSYYQNLCLIYNFRKKKLPVVLHIHGGAFRQRGGANLPVEAILREAPDTVVVSINYRLGAFGMMTVLNNSIVPSMYLIKNTNLRIH